MEGVFVWLTLTLFAVSFGLWLLARRHVRKASVILNQANEALRESQLNVTRAKSAHSQVMKIAAVQGMLGSPPKRPETPRAQALSASKRTTTPAAPVQYYDYGTYNPIFHAPVYDTPSRGDDCAPSSSDSGSSWSSDSGDCGGGDSGGGGSD